MGEYLYNIGERANAQGTYLTIEKWEIVGQTPKYYKIQRRDIPNKRAMEVTHKVAREVVDCRMAINQHPHQYMYSSRGGAIAAYISYKEQIVKRARHNIWQAEEAIKDAKSHKFALDWDRDSSGWESDK